MKRTEKTWFPRPVDTSRVILSEALLKHKNEALDQIHQMWAIQKWINFIKDHPDVFTGTPEELEVLLSYKPGESAIPFDLLAKANEVPDSPYWKPTSELTPDEVALDDATAYGILKFLAYLGVLKDEEE